MLSQAVENWQSRAIWVISRADSAYPQRYKNLLGQNRPPILYGCGDVALLDSGGLAVVGSRQISDDLIAYTEGIGRLAAGAQCTLVSGGAPGVDQSAVKGVLDGGGTSVVVLPAKLENGVILRDYRDALMDGRLALISPYDPKAGWSIGQAMGRNKLIYGLSEAALVVESSYNKGGTWPGAVEQLERLHFVPVYVRSAGEYSKGLEGLLRKGALKWAEPKTPEGFRAILANEQYCKKGESPNQATLLLETAGVVSPGCDDTTEEATSQPPPSVENVSGEMSPGADLFAKVEQLLDSIDTPTTESTVAEYLEVSQRQAGDWLKRLEREGKYRRLTKPVRYERVSPIERLI